MGVPALILSILSIHVITTLALAAKELLCYHVSMITLPHEPTARLAALGSPQTPCNKFVQTRPKYHPFLSNRRPKRLPKSGAPR